MHRGYVEMWTDVRKERKKESTQLSLAIGWWRCWWWWSWWCEIPNCFLQIGYGNYFSLWFHAV